MQALVDLQLKAEGTRVGFPLFWVNSFSHTAAQTASHMCSPASPAGSCTKCLATVTLQSPCKRLWLHTSEGSPPPTPRDVCRGLPLFSSPLVLSLAPPHFLALLSHQLIYHSRFVALPFMDTFEKARGLPVPRSDGVNPTASRYLNQICFVLL